MILTILFFTSIFYLFDLYLINQGYKGTYYLNHYLANTYITYLTFNDVINTYFDFNNIINHEMNLYAVCIVYSLHYYHIIYYFSKLKLDDWLHHITMIFIALPLGTIIKCGSLLGHSMFFTTGLPGSINYFLMFLQRNNFIEKTYQKSINRYLNLWFRMPGCVSQFILSLIFINLHIKDNYQYIFGLITGILTFWNGIYYMDMVVRDYAIQQYKN
jgi:hypothetical protein